MERRVPFHPPSPPTQPMQDLFPHPVRVNTLLEHGFIAQQRGDLAQAHVPHGLAVWLVQHFDVATLAIRSAAQLQEKFTGPRLRQLGWASITQETLVVQGKRAKPDWRLLLDPGQDDRKNNPHRHLQARLGSLRVRCGGETRGRAWRQQCAHSTPAPQLPPVRSASHGHPARQLRKSCGTGAC